MDIFERLTVSGRQFKEHCNFSFKSWQSTSLHLLQKQREILKIYPGSIFLKSCFAWFERRGDNKKSLSMLLCSWWYCWNQYWRVILVLHPSGKEFHFVLWNHKLFIMSNAEEDKWLTGVQIQLEGHFSFSRCILLAFLTLKGSCRLWLFVWLVVLIVTTTHRITEAPGCLHHYYQSLLTSHSCLLCLRCSHGVNHLAVTSPIFLQIKEKCILEPSKSV